MGHRQVTATARRHGICRSLLTTWRRQYRNGELGSAGSVSFAPVTVPKEVSTSQANPIDSSPPPDCRIEVALPNGRRLILPIGVETEALARLLAVVDRQ
ncbi:transposase [Sulfitobacter sp. 1A12779]|uniref:transposase n=1 Tax=Sulfitobacter sp. 1A12779 TaxID=3368599 RepID=UPI0037461249